MESQWERDGSPDKGESFGQTVYKDLGFLDVGHHLLMPIPTNAASLAAAVDSHHLPRYLAFDPECCEDIARRALCRSSFLLLSISLVSVVGACSVGARGFLAPLHSLGFFFDGPGY